MREEVDGNSLKRAMKVIIIPFSIRSRWRSNQTTRCISSRKFMYEPENQNGFTLEPIIEHLLLQLHVCFAGSGNSHDFFSRWTSCHEQNTWYIHTMRKEKKRHSRNIWEMNPSTHFITITILLTCSKKIYFENKIKHISFNYYHDVICEMILEAHVTPDIQNTRPLAERIIHIPLRVKCWPIVPVHNLQVLRMRALQSIQIRWPVAFRAKHPQYPAPSRTKKYHLDLSSNHYRAV